MTPSDRPLPALFAGDLLGSHELTLAMLTQALCAAQDLRVLDHLAAEPRPVSALAERTAGEPAALRRLLRTLAVMDVVRPDGDDAFTLGPLAGFAEPTRAQRDACWASVPGAEDWYVDAWRGLTESVRTGETAFERIHGRPFFAFLEARDDAAAVFDAAMSREGRSATRDAAVAAAQSPPPGATVVDLGGGTGGLLAAMLGAQAESRGVLVERPQVCNAARARLAALGLGERASVVPGDLFGRLPAEARDAEVLLLSSILHDWDDDDAIRILRRAREAMAPASRLLIVELLLPEGNEPGWAQLLDLEMLVLTGGRERSAREYTELVARAGLRAAGVRPTASMWSVVEARLEQDGL